MKQLRRIGLFGLLLVLSTTLIPSAFAQRSRGPQADLAALACRDEEGSSVRPLQYTLALIPGDIREQAHEPSLNLPIVVFVREASNSLFPIIQDHGLYFVLCHADLDHLMYFADAAKTYVGITPFTTQTLAGLETAKQSQGTELARWGAIALRADEHGSDFVDWPAEYRMQLPERDMLKNLIQKFEREGRTLLAGMMPATKLTVSLPRTKRYDWPEKKGVAPANAVAQRPNGSAPSPLSGPGPVRTVPPNGESATQQPLPAPAPAKTVQPNGESATQPLPAAAAPNRPEQSQQPVKFTIGFLNPQWASVRLIDEQVKFDQDKRINTFGYCRDETISRDERGLNYELDCNPAEDGTIPVQIRGFKTVVVGRSEARQIDTKLEVVSFSEPYPRQWNTTRIALFEVPGGRLNDVLKAPIDLNQNVPGTQACSETKRISVAEIVAHHVDFPAPPCTRYSITFDPGLTDQTAEVLENCLPGATARRPILEGRVVCWKKQVETNLKLQLRAGFEPIPIPVPASLRDDIHYGLANLDGYLRPWWPYAGASPFDDANRRGETPKYIPRLIEYGDNSGPCPKPIEVGGTFTVPTIRDAKCAGMPTWIHITFAKDATSREIPSSKAFLDTYTDKYDIRDVLSRSSRPVDIGNVKKQLPIRFRQDGADEYLTQFQTQRSGVLRSDGVYVFSGNGDKCGLPTAGKFVPFDPRINDPQTFVWPQVAAVYGNSANHAKLTSCAQARVEENAAGEPYLTFDLDAVLANGQRRVIIIANNDALHHGISKQVREALADLIEELDKQRRQYRAPLSPVSVYSMNIEGGLRLLFTGEDAVHQKAAAKSRLNDFDTVAPSTPDFNDLDMRQEVRENAESLIVVMDGSATGDQYISGASRLIRRFQDLGGLTFLMKADYCNKWRHDLPYPTFHCEQISQDRLSAAFMQLVSHRQTRAGELSPAQSGR